MGNASTAQPGPITIGRVDADNMEGAGAGWYYDPEDQAIYRYWDGTSWTEHRADTVLSEIPS